MKHDSLSPEILSHPNASLYEAPLLEWSNDLELPMKTVEQNRSRIGPNGLSVPSSSTSQLRTCIVRTGTSFRVDMRDVA
jgi:hypothetical protein